MKIKIWGARGSIPTPLTPSSIEEKLCQAILGMPDIDTTDSEAVQAYVQELPFLSRRTAGGNTSCVEIQSGDETFIIDAGSGLRELGLELMNGPCRFGKGILHLFFTHCHWDHIQGFPFFVPAFIPGNQIFVYSVHDVQAALTGQQNYPYFPVPLTYLQGTMEFIHLEPRQSITINDMRISNMENAHPGRAYSYRFEDKHSVYVHASDAEFKQLDEVSVQPYIDFFRGADALTFDAQYTLREAWQKVDWGHSSALIGVDLARMAGAKRLILFHHDPTYSDNDLQEMLVTAQAYQAQDPARPTCEVFVAYEGLTLDLTPPGTVDLQLSSDGEVAIVTPLDDSGNFDTLAQQLMKLEQQKTATSSVIDLSQLETLTTANLKEIVALSQQRQDRPVVLAAPSMAIQQVIKLAGYLDYFPIYTSIEAALTAVQAREALNLPGQVIRERYQIQKKLDEDSLTAVLKAVDTVTNETVIVKILNPACSQETTDRVMRQMKKLVSLDYSRMVKVLTWGQDGDYSFIVEEYIEGATLEEAIQQKNIAFLGEQALEISLELMRVLEYAHSRGIVHSDVRPKNIFLTETGLKLGGFGLGRLAEGRHLLDAPLLLLPTPYLAPEQILGQALDARTDLYALGVILYQLFTGVLPFRGSDQEIMRAHIHQKPRPPREINAHISLSLEHLILKLLSKNPNGRYASAQQTHRIFSNLTVSVDDLIHQRRGPLIEREKQSAILYTYWQETCAGEGKLVFVTGESGIGKTTLVQRVAALSEPPVLLVGRCQEVEEKTAYHLFSEALYTYFATVPPEFFDEEARHLLSNFVRLVPEIYQMLPDLLEPSPLEPEQEQLRLMTNLTQFIRRATQERPWFLILDNLQWADQNSLELLRYLSHHLPSMALLIVGIYRDVELEPGHPLLDTLRDLRSHPTYEHIHLDRLDQAGVEQILSHIWQQPVSPLLAEKVYQHTGGNPFYVEEVANGLMDDGLVVWQDGEWHFPVLDEVRLPSSVHEAVWRRISRLNPGTQTLLREAAVLGQMFRYEDLQAISGLSEWQVLEHIDIALERQLVQEVPGADTMLRFRHAEIHHVLYTDLGLLRRRLLHRTVAEWYESTYLNNRERDTALLSPSHHPVAIIPLLVHHFHEAADPERECYYAKLAGEEAARNFANHDAIAYLSRALSLTPRDERARRYSLLLVREKVYHVLGRREEQARDLAELENLAEILSAEDDDHAGARRQAEVALRHANYADVTGDYPAAIRAAQLAIELAQRSQDPYLKAMAHLKWGEALSHMSDYDMAHPQFAQALDLAEEAHLIPIKASSLRNLGTVYWQQGNYAGSIKCDKQALALYRNLGDLHGEGKMLGNLGVFFIDQGDYVQAVTHYTRALEIYRGIGDRRGEGIVLSNLGEAFVDLGDYVQAKSYLEQALMICREIGDRQGEATRMCSLAQLFHRLDDHKTAKIYSEHALTLARQLGNGRIKGYALTNLGHALAGLNQLDEAADAYEQACQLRQRLGEVHRVMDPLAGLARVSLRQGDNQQAMRHVESILDYLEHHTLDGTEDPFQIYLTCYEVLRTNDDARVEKMLETAYQMLWERAAKITDEKTRRSFLENVTSHKAIQTARDKSL